MPSGRNPSVFQNPREFYMSHSLEMILSSCKYQLVVWSSHFKSPELFSVFKLIWSMLWSARSRFFIWFPVPRVIRKPSGNVLSSTTNNGITVTLVFTLSLLVQNASFRLFILTQWFSGKQSSQEDKLFSCFINTMTGLLAGILGSVCIQNPGCDTIVVTDPRYYTILVRARTSAKCNTMNPRYHLW